jgi:hypothetical protein
MEDASSCFISSLDHEDIQKPNAVDIDFDARDKNEWNFKVFVKLFDQTYRGNRFCRSFLSSRRKQTSIGPYG